MRAKVCKKRGMRLIERKRTGIRRRERSERIGTRAREGAASGVGAGAINKEWQENRRENNSEKKCTRCDNKKEKMKGNMK